MRVTASKRALLSHCHYWAREGVPWDETTGRAAKDGDAFHKAVEAWVNGQDPVAWQLPAGMRRRWPAMQEWLETHRRPTWRSEMAIRYTLSGAARVLGYSIGRQYGDHESGTMCGSIDIIDVGDELEVLDVKTGRSVNAVWGQMRTLGLFAAVAMKRDRVRLRVIHATETGVYEYPEDLDGLDLAGEAHQLREDVAKIKAAEPTPGTWCDEMFCPARAACGAYQQRRAG